MQERDARDGELIVKVMEEDRSRDREVASVSIPLDKFIDGVERKTFRLDGGGAVRITADFGSQSRRDDSEDAGNQKLEVDMKVEARYRGKSKYYPGVISRVRLNGTVDINYDDGEKELGVKPELVRVIEDRSRSSRKSKSPSRSSRGPKVGQKCTAQFKGKGKFYPGKISKVNSDGTVNVDFNDGDKNRYVDMQCVKLEDGGGSDSETETDTKDQKLEIDMKVEARYRGKSKYYPGVITRVRLNGTVDINYDDGEKELGVKPELVRILEDKSRSSRKSSSKSRSRRSESVSSKSSDEGPEFVKHDKVSARYNKKSKFYPAKITKVHKDGTFDLEYSDSSKKSEKNVKAKYIKARSRSESPASDSSSSNRRGRKGRSPPKSKKHDDMKASRLARFDSKDPGSNSKSKSRSRSRRGRSQSSNSSNSSRSSGSDSSPTSYDFEQGEQIILRPSLSSPP